jgi:diguanylate cyclase (GGDEF)-like protein
MNAAELDQLRAEIQRGMHQHRRARLALFRLLHVMGQGHLDAVDSETALHELDFRHWLNRPVPDVGAPRQRMLNELVASQSRLNRVGESVVELARKAQLAADGLDGLIDALLDLDRANQKYEQTVIRDLIDLDPLTEAANRHALDRDLSQVVEKSASSRGESLAVIMVDIDHFKSVNDNHGHPVGDEVLIELVQRLDTLTRGTDVVYRFGGEEFAVIATCLDSADLMQLLERMRAGIERPAFNTQAGPLTITVSLGATQYQPGDAPETLIKRADEGLYVAKSAGRNRYVITD